MKIVFSRGVLKNVLANAHHAPFKDVYGQVETLMKLHVAVKQELLCLVSKKHEVLNYN